MWAEFTVIDFYLFPFIYVYFLRMGVLPEYVCVY